MYIAQSSILGTASVDSETSCE